MTPTPGTREKLEELLGDKGRAGALGGGAGPLAHPRAGEPRGAAWLRPGRGGARAGDLRQGARRRRQRRGRGRARAARRRQRRARSGGGGAHADRAVGEVRRLGLPTLRALQDAKLPWRPSVVQAVTFEHPHGIAAAALLRAAYEARRRRPARRAHAGHPRLQAGDGARPRGRAARAGAGVRRAASASAVCGRPRRWRRWAGPELAKLAASPHAGCARRPPRAPTRRRW